MTKSKKGKSYKQIKKLIKIIFSVFCWIIGLILLYETIESFINGDGWGLTFCFITLPCGVLSFLFLSEAIILTSMLRKELIKK